MLKIGWNDGHTLTGLGTGAVGIIKETDRNRAIGKLARQYLSEYEGVEIINCTLDKSNNDMSEAVAIANNNNCDLFISNHVNAGGGRGFEGFYSRLQKTATTKGKVIYDELVNTKSCLMARRFCDDYSYKGFDLYVLKNTKMEAYLFEIGFVDNAECCNAVKVEEVAKSYALGIARAYNLKKKGGAMVEGIILYKGEADGFLANWLGLTKGYPVAKNDTKVDLSQYKEVICVGFSAKDYPKCTKLIAGTDRKATLLALYNAI